MQSSASPICARNAYLAIPAKKPVQILRFAEGKKEPLSRKILGKTAQNALGKGTGPSNLHNTAVGIFLSRLKKWAQKSPEVVETSGLFAAASIWVQLDGAGYGNRTRLLGLGSRCTTDVLILRFSLGSILSSRGAFCNRFVSIRRKKIPRRFCRGIFLLTLRTLCRGTLRSARGCRAESNQTARR